MSSHVSSEICGGGHFSRVEKISSPHSLVIDEDAYEVYSEYSDSDTEFILLGGPASATRSHAVHGTKHSEVERLSTALGELSIDSSAAVVHGLNAPVEDDVKKSKRALKRKRQNAARKARRRAQREQAKLTSHPETAGVSSYKEAYALISRYIANPQDPGNDDLLLLQALIIELGVRSPDDLPSTLTSARKLLKSEVHINIKEYVATRDKGQKALQQIMHPSKVSLRRQIQETGNRASLKWVKKRGLQVLLVLVFG
ncbi:hypothetical protein BKA82DRAFT_992962 [Pisolithus tinctorius]|uniref:Uncharacterized protein n=1 Tax=Pisolithus tinctorius Marx 270 TaxID=870435 RepID=A0A0C3PHA8_PISTI|nr:hypothetical protein BKA82DRAFT_992962 [Pisolithus tinctorius]KIO13400.1 hypothetical protein M404DRAFT_992962 [Pisolithus tinctorius Marx 270]